MRQEWRHYWKETRRSQRSALYALGVSVFLWATQLPITAPEDYLKELIISLIYGQVVALAITLTFGLGWAAVTQMRIWNPSMKRPKTLFNFALGLFGSGAGIFIAEKMKGWWFERPVTTSQWVYSMMLGALIAMVFAFYYAFRESQRENLALVAANSENELHVLKNQMQPHFLFNSLNSLSELIEVDRDAASDVAMKLSDLYREILESSKKSLVSLQHEISIVQKYLELERVRFGERLSFSISVPENGESVMVPPLVLQTLVENAIKHGIAPSLSGGQLKVSVAPAASKGYDVEIWNTGALRENKNSGTGIANTRARLDLLYGNQHGFTVNERGGAVEARFWVSGHA